MHTRSFIENTPLIPSRIFTKRQVMTIYSKESSVCNGCPRSSCLDCIRASACSRRLKFLSSICFIMHALYASNSYLHSSLSHWPFRYFSVYHRLKQSLYTVLRREQAEALVLPAPIFGIGSRCWRVVQAIWVSRNSRSRRIDSRRFTFRTSSCRWRALCS